MPADEILTLEEAGAFGKISKTTLKKLIISGRLKAVDVGAGHRHHYRIAKKDLLAFFGVKPDATGEGNGSVNPSAATRSQIRL